MICSERSAAVGRESAHSKEMHSPSGRKSLNICPTQSASVLRLSFTRSRAYLALWRCSGRWSAYLATATCATKPGPATPRAIGQLGASAWVYCLLIAINQPMRIGSMILTLVLAAIELLIGIRIAGERDPRADRERACRERYHAASGGPHPLVRQHGANRIVLHAPGRCAQGTAQSFRPGECFHDNRGAIFRDT